MANLKLALAQMDNPDKSIGLLLIQFYQQMKQLESDEFKEGKQATKICMTMSDIDMIYKPEKYRNDLYKTQP